jgi:hypothetical protein
MLGRLKRNSRFTGIGGWLSIEFSIKISRSEMRKEQPSDNFLQTTHQHRQPWLLHQPRRRRTSSHSKRRCLRSGHFLSWVETSSEYTSTVAGSTTPER